MKRSLIAIAAFLLLLSSTTYASPPRSRVRMRFFWGPVLAWFGFGHQHDGRMAWQDEYGRRPPAYAPEHGYMPPGQRGRPNHGHGWQNGQHKGWDRHDPGRRDRGGSDGSGEGEHGNGRGNGHGPG